MNPATTTISSPSHFDQDISIVKPEDLFQLVDSLATLNLGYLTITATLLLAVFSLLGGAFVYFNIRPLKESLSKQEDRVREAEQKTSERMEAFQDEQRSNFDDISLKLDTRTKKLEQQVEIVSSSLKKKLTSRLIEFKENMQSSFEVLKESILNETSKNYEIEREKVDKAVLALDSKIAEQIISLERKLIAEISEVKRSLSNVKDSLRDIEVDVKELQVEEFTRKGQQGAILNRIDLLGIDIDAKTEWRISERLISIRDYVEKHPIRTTVNDSLIKQLSKLEGKSAYADLVSEIKKFVKVQGED